MKEEALIFNGKNYISSRRAAEISGYTIDYIGQLSRAGKIDSQMVGRTRFIGEASLAEYQYLNTKEKALSSQNNPQDKVIKPETTPNVTRPQNENGTYALPKPATTSSSRDGYNFGRFTSVPHKSAVSLIGLAKTGVALTTLVLVAAFFMSPFGKLGIENFASVITLSGERSGAVVHDAIFSDSTSTASTVDPLAKIDAVTLAPFHWLDQHILAIGSFVRDHVLAFFEKGIRALAGKNSTESSTTVASNVSTTTLSTTTVVASAASGGTVSEAQVRAIVQQMLSEEGSYVGTPQGGMVTVPSTGDAQADALLKQKIQDSFSDKVVVSLDQSRTSGVISPQFRRVTDDKYLFVLVPVQR